MSYASTEFDWAVTFSPTYFFRVDLRYSASQAFDQFDWAATLIKNGQDTQDIQDEEPVEPIPSHLFFLPAFFRVLHLRFIYRRFSASDAYQDKPVVIIVDKQFKYGKMTTLCG